MEHIVNKDDFEKCRVHMEDAKDNTEATSADISMIKTIEISAYIIAVHIVKELYGSPGWGRTKLQKSLYLIEYACQLDLNSYPVLQTVGPFDQSIINTLDQEFRHYGHVRKKTIKDKYRRTRYNYVPTAKISEVEYAFERYPQEVQQKVNDLLAKIKRMDLVRAEIVSTLYAVWNNHIIKNQEITDALLLDDFYAWSPHKPDFDKDSVLQGLDYMKRENIIPIGWGKYIDKI